MNIEIISIDEFDSSERSMTREEALKVLEMFLHKQCDLKRTEFAYDANTVWDAVNIATKVLEQESNDEKELIKGHCICCKHFERDVVAKVDGIPLIVGHEMCNKWGNGCKTREDGYCFLFEPIDN